MIHVCSLAALPATVEATGARHVLTVMGDIEKVTRPVSVLEENHLKIKMDDIIVPADGFVVPSGEHIERALSFVRKWDRAKPLVIHCWAGISRSTASAFMTACALNPNRDEFAIARHIRASSPNAQPNRLIVTLADQALKRNGRMVEALDMIGPGNLTVEGNPFRIDLE